MDERELVQRYLDGELDSAARNEVERRIETNSEFRDLFQEFASVQEISSAAFSDYRDREAAIRVARRAIASLIDFPLTGAGSTEYQDTPQRPVPPTWNPIQIAVSAAVGFALATILLLVWLPTQQAPGGEARVTLGEGPELATAAERHARALQYLREEKNDIALRDAEAAFRIRDTLLPPSDPAVLESVSLLVRIHLARGETDAAAKLLEQTASALRLQ